MKINVNNILIVFYTVLLLFYKFGSNKLTDELFINLTLYLHINGFLQTAFLLSNTIKELPKYNNCNKNFKDCNKAYKIYKIIKENNKKLLSEYFNNENMEIPLEELFIVQYSIYQNWDEDLWNNIDSTIADNNISRLKENPDLYEIYKELYKDCNSSYKECRRAYTKYGLEYHPDKHPEEQDKYTKLFKSLDENYRMFMKLNYNIDK